MAITSSSIYMVASPLIQPVVSPPTALAQPQVLSPLQRFEKGEYGADGSSSYSSTSQVEDTEPENLAPPPKADFLASIDQVRNYLNIDDPAKTEKYKLGSRLGHDPNMFKME